MIRNYLKIAIRSLIAHARYTLLNIIGLAVGIAVSLLILLFVSHEYTFDRFHAEAPNIYRVFARVKWGDQQLQMFALSPAFGEAVQQQQPEVRRVTRIRNRRDRAVIAAGNQRYFEQQVIFADSAFFQVFSFPLLQGNGADLARANQAFITPDVAVKYFGNESPIGKTLLYNNNLPLEVVGIVSAAPSNSTIQYSIIISLPTLAHIPEEKGQYEHNRVSLGAFETFLQLRDPAAAAQVEKGMSSLPDKSVDEQYLLEPLTAIHLGNNMGDTSNTMYLTLFITVAALVLGLALINYINLTTARLSVRSKEVGIRKMVGASRMSLSVLFYIESAITTLLAFVLAVTVVQLVLPVMLSKFGQQIDVTFLRSPVFIIGVIMLLLVCVLVAGSYPALVLSRAMPVAVWKGTLSGKGEGAWIRKTLTVFQMTASVALIVCSIVVHDQLNHLRDKKLGLNKEQVLVLPMETSDHYLPFRDALRHLSGVRAVGAASFALYKGGTSGFFTQTPTTHEDVFINVISVDTAFISVLDIPWLKRSDLPLRPDDLIINEAAVDKLKLNRDSISGAALMLGKDSSPIVGLVQNFDISSARYAQEALVMSIQYDSTAASLLDKGSCLYLQLASTQGLEAQLQQIKVVHEQHRPDVPFDYYFLDDAFQHLYEAEQRLSFIFTTFTGLAIWIACMGMFGLVAFSTERRLKEIGIRKVLGAPVPGIILMLSREFFILLLISILLAVPVSWWGIQRWLSAFAYHIQVSAGVFVLAAVMMIVIAACTLILQTIRAAHTNPAQVLKRE